MTSGRDIDYEGLAQDAMRGVVRQVMARVAKAGRLPGEHHFYISFKTRDPGVSMSRRLLEQYPEEMTIVLQHLFWDLQVNEDRFEVKLKFDGIAERLAIPFKAIKVFFDPSVPYGLQFEAPEAAPAGEHDQRSTGQLVDVASARGDRQEGREPRSRPAALPAASGEPKTADSRSKRRPASVAGAPPPAASGDDRRPRPVDAKAKVRPVETEPSKKKGEDRGRNSAQIVELDAFRKK